MNTYHCSSSKSLGQFGYSTICMVYHSINSLLCIGYRPLHFRLLHFRLFAPWYTTQYTTQYTLRVSDIWIIHHLKDKSSFRKLISFGQTRLNVLAESYAISTKILVLICLPACQITKRAILKKYLTKFRLFRYNFVG